MRARNIKPGIFKNEILGQADLVYTVLFEGLWCLADKAGRLEDRPLRIKGEIFPYREGLDVNRYLTDLERWGFIIRYTVEGQNLIQVVEFERHQHPHHTERPSELPAPSVENRNGCDLTVKELLANGCTPSDSLIPDSLISTPLSPQGGKSDAETFLPMEPHKSNRKRKGKYQSEDIAPENAEYLRKVYERIPAVHPVTGDQVHKGPFATAARAFQSIVDAGEATARELMAVGTLYYRAETLGPEWVDWVNKLWDTRCKAMMHVSSLYGPEKRPYRQLLPAAREVIKRKDEQATLQAAS